MSSPRQPRIYVLAGVNGAGKSSIAGAAFREKGGEYYNPDEVAGSLMKADPTLTQADANAAAWSEGVRLLTRAIEERYEHSRLNLIELLPSLTALRVYDNSVDADPAAGRAPMPVLVLHVERGKILNPRDLSRTPNWAKPIVAAALKLSLG
jgi:predicted ABC-type ATPase